MNNTNSATDIAKYFIWKSHKENKQITNKKLQKLLYYSQAWFLVLKNKPLFRENIEAWIHGPAIRNVYQKYKIYGFGPIAEKVEDEVAKEVPNREFLENVWKIYGKYDADYLERLSHNEDPWQIARNKIEENESSSAVISHGEMKKFYSSMLHA